MTTWPSDYMTTKLQHLLVGLRSLKLDGKPVIAHASLSAFGQVLGGSETLVSALLAVFDSVVMPAFTYKTMIIPPSGPEYNAIPYDSGSDANRMAEFFDPKMPADPLMGILAEALRKHPNARRSTHPILSFAGVDARTALAAQTLSEPFATIDALVKKDGWVLLLGVNQTVNTSIHYAEKLAGRKQFTRWALTPRGVRACPGFPGCSAGFQSIAPDIERYARQARVGEATVQAVPLKRLVRVVVERIKSDPLALLCQREDCERCNAIRIHHAAG
ncbi:MAG: AAC(3) family N-acetyltransferase [Chloroflexi bacterium]|nr:AAC(3) family N-acetyltransferase [Chloroflexota bacterium]